MKIVPAFFCCLSCALTVCAQAQPFVAPEERLWRIEKVNPDYDWTRHFRIGALVGLNIRADFKMSGDFGIASGNPAAGIYDDGYVRVDNTGNAQGYTSYWGYQSASQISGSTLTMHSSQSFSTSGNASGDDSPYLGFDLAYGDSYWYWGGAKIGWEFGFGLLPIHIADNHPMSATVTRSVYQFNLPTSTPDGPFVPPTAPYNGGPSGIGPTIFAAPTQLPDDTISGTVTGTRALDTVLYTFRLGPSLYWNLGRRFGVYASAGPALGLVSGELNYNETILLPDGSSAHNTGHISATDLVFGGYVNATLVYHAQAGGDFYVGAQYMPMGNAGFSGGGRQGNLDLGGQIYLTAGINWPF